MLLKIDNATKLGKQVGGFGIQILYPGAALPNSIDTGFATIGRIDQAKVTPNTLVPMHCLKMMFHICNVRFILTLLL